MAYVKHPTLYKRTVTGAVHCWYQERTLNMYRTVSGQLDGQMTFSAWTEATAKNLNKANEISPNEQCILEVASNYKKKLAQGGYHTSIEDIDTSKYFKPMLAKQYDDYPLTSIEYNSGSVYAQPKLDGIRCITTNTGMWSRSGKPIVSAPHIFEQLAPLFALKPDLIFDGELYTHRLKDNFNQIISLARKQLPSKLDLELSEEYLEYHVYDLPSYDGPFCLRYTALVSALSAFNRNLEISDQPPLKSVYNVTTHKVISEPHLDDLYQQFLQQGYEGQIVRIDGYSYENKRHRQLLKRKEWIDEEFTVVDIEEGIGNRSGLAGAIVYQLSQSQSETRTFKSGIRGDWDYAKSLLTNKSQYIGGQGTVRYLNRTPDNIPRHGVTIALYPSRRDL